MANAIAGFICQGGFLEKVASDLSAREGVEWKAGGQVGIQGEQPSRSSTRCLNTGLKQGSAGEDGIEAGKAGCSPIGEGVTCQGKETRLCSAGSLNK